MERYVTTEETETEDSELDIATVSYEDLKEATSDFSESNKLGKGGFGNVYRGNLRGIDVAIKTLLSPGDAHQVKAFRQEVDVLGRLKHKHLVRLIGACPEKFALVYEFMQGGTLEDQIKDLLWDERLRIATEICSALVFLHSPNPDVVVHGDVKPENILLHANGTSKLGDFGICKLIPISSTTTTMHLTTDVQGSIGYLDPLFIQSRRLTPSADVYSFGMVLLRLLTKQRAAGHGLVGIVQGAMEDRHLDDILCTAANWPYSLAEELSKVAISCCDMRVKKRPDLARLCKILRKMKWEYSMIPNEIQLENGMSFSYLELRRATSNFSDSNKLGNVHVDMYRGNLMGKEAVIKEPTITGDAYFAKEFHQEVEILSVLKHPHIIPLMGKCHEEHVIVYDFVACGTLEDRLGDGRDFPWQDRLRIAIEICSALVYLHSRKPAGVVHGNVLPESVLLDANDKSMLCDFSISLLIISNEETKASYNSDVNDFGELLLCLLAKVQAVSIAFIRVGAVALDYHQFEDLIDNVADWPYQLAEQLFYLAIRCCNKRKNLRPPSTEILEQLEEMEEQYLI